MIRKTLITLLGSWFFMSGNTAIAQEASPDEVQLFEKGLFLEDTKRDLAGAIGAYEAVLASDSPHPEIAMRARFRLAGCQLKSGDANSAKATLEGLIDTLPDADSLAEPGDEGPRRSVDQDFAEIVERALPDIDQETLLDTAFEAVAARLGHRADYLDKHELADQQVHMTQKLVGIGAILAEQEDDGTLIIGTISAGPAADAGLENNDVILEVDGRSTADFEKGLREIVGAIRGEEGTTVNLRIKRHSTGRIATFGIVRRHIELKDTPPVTSMSLTDGAWLIDEKAGIAGIRISSFAIGTAEKCREAIGKSLEQGAKAIVLDLQNNGGGSLDECVETADLFVREGVIVRVVSTDDDDVNYLAKADGTTGADLPMVVLINDKTASAAEILAGCLQDHERSTMIGTRSMGVGIVRTVMPVTGGGALILPISEFLKPSGAQVHSYPGAEEDSDWGIRPTAGFSEARGDMALERALQHLRKELEEQ